MLEGSKRRSDAPMTKEIPLTQGKVALVDDGDFDEVSKYKWCALKSGNTWYAYRNTRSLGKRSAICMHRAINKTPLNFDTDHKNGNGLDNRKCNLRSVTHRQNLQNQKNRKGKSSVFPGVCFCDGKWEAQITTNGSSKFIGYFSSEGIAFHFYRSELDRLGEHLIGTINKKS